jgi:hypothetical protein
VSASANTTGAERSGTVVLGAGGLQVSFAVSQDEHGDSTSAATGWSVASSGTAQIRGTLGVGLDWDYFRIVAPSTGTYAIRSALSAEGDVYGYLYNSSGAQLVGNDDGAGYPNFLISYALTAGQTYYVAVRNYNQSYPNPVAYTISSTK